MIASWMLYTAAVGALMTIAALALDRALTARGRATRGVWAAAIALSLLVPAVDAIPRQWFRRAPTSQVLPFAITVAAPDAIVINGGSLNGAQIINRALIALWLGGSVLLMFRLARAARTLRSMRQQWRRDEIDGVAVHLSSNVGPAVVGLGPMHVVLPEWILALDAPHRALVLKHEQEHREARDPYLLFGSALSVALMPWNPALWIQSERLRLAIEMDCDARVLRAHPTPERYGLLMLTIAQRRSIAPTLFAPMLSEPTTHLERRIVAMRASTHRFNRVMTYGAMAFSAAVLVLAGSLRSASAKPRVPVEVRAPATAARETQQGNPGPRYPDMLRQAEVEGTVIAEFSTDASGVPDMSTLKFVASSHDMFAMSVRGVLPRWHLAPSTTLRIPFMFVMADKSGQALTSIPPNAVVITGIPVAATREPTMRPPEPRVETSGVRKVNPVVVTSVGQGAPDSAATAALRRANAAGEKPVYREVPVSASVVQQPRVVEPNQTLLEFQVERPATPLPGNPAPRYPDLLRSANVEGTVLAQFVVDTLGHADMSTFKALKSTHELFTEAVLKSLPNMRFSPAEVGGRKVKQLLQMPFEFNLTKQ
ncbi:MAG TPA: TonB family protein [Gemmatimonadaceae bacterium]|nr:TonB family protein [Gemmatimonadaceae bacterium]